MDEDIVERSEGPAHVLVERVSHVHPPARVWLAVANASLLVAALALVAVRAQAPPAITQGSSAPAVGRLTGPGPFLVYAVRDNERRPRVYAVRPEGGAPVFLGEFPGILNEGAGRQGQAAGAAVPILTVQSTVDDNATTRLWLIRRDRPPERILSTTDLVAGFTLSHDVSRVAIARRSARSVSRGFFLHVHNADGSGPTLIVPLRRPGGESSRDALRPVGWTRYPSGVVLLPFCDQCAVVPTGVYRYVFGASVKPFTATTAGPVLAADVTMDGSVVHVEQELPPEPCRLPPGSSGRSQLLTCRNPVRFAAVDTGRDRLREIVRSSELPLGPPLVSPSGDVIAYASGRNHEIEWRSTSGGEVLGAIDVPVADFAPVAWLDENRFVALAFDEDIGSDSVAQTSLVLVTRGTLRGGGETGASLSVLATGPDLAYLGWLR